MALSLPPALPERAWHGGGHGGSGSIPDLSRLIIAGPPPGPLPAGLAPLPLSSTVGGLPGMPLGVLSQPALPQGVPQHVALPGHPLQAKRGVEINTNKAITKCLASAVHYQQVLDCVADYIGVFDEVNVATALHRMAKLQPQAPGAQPSAVVFAEQFQRLVATARALLPRFEAQAVSNTMWAFATLNYIPDGRLLEDLGRHAATIIRTFRPQATSNTLWAFAKLGVSPPRVLLTAAAQQMLQDLPKSVPQDISNTLWAFATLRHHPGEGLMRAAAHHAVLVAQRFKPQELANTLWAYASLEHDPGQALRCALAVQMVSRIQQFRQQAVSNSLWAFAKLGCAPPPPLLDVACQRAASMMHQYTCQEVANTLWALATLRHHPGPALLDAAALQIARRMEQFSPQDAASSIWAYAQLFHHPCKEAMQGIALHLLRHWQRFQAGDLATALESLAILDGCSLQAWQLLTAKLAAVPAASFDDRALRRLFHAHLLIAAAMTRAGLAAVAPGLPPPLLAAAEHAWRDAAQRGAASVLQEQVSRTLWSWGLAHHSQQLCAGGLFRVDIALDGTNAVIEILGPDAYAANTRTPLGQTVSRRLALEASGLSVFLIPHYDWEWLETGPQRERYLSSLLQRAPAPL